MRPSLRRTIAILTVIWIVLVLTGELLFMLNVFNNDGRKACYSCAFDRASAQQRPGSWNGGVVWSQGQANAYRWQYTRLFLREVWERSQLPVLLVTLFLAAVILLCISAVLVAERMKARKRYDRRSTLPGL